MFLKQMYTYGGVFVVFTATQVCFKYEHEVGSALLVLHSVNDSLLYQYNFTEGFQTLDI